MTVSVQTRRRIYWAISIAVVGFAIYFFYQNRSEWNKLETAFAKYNLLQLVLCFLAVTAQLAFQSLRLWAVIPDRSRADIPRATNSLVLGQVLNSFLPARAGDALKAIRLTTTEFPLSSSIGVLLADKLVDVCSFFLMCAAASPFWIKNIPPPRLFPTTETILLVAGGIVVLFIIPWLLPRVRSRMLTMIYSFANGLKALRSPKAFSWALLFSWLGWLSEIVCLWVLCSGQGRTLSLTELVWILAILNVGIAVPVAVANVGAFEAAMVLAFNALGISADTALAVAIAHHGIQIITIVWWGAVVTGLNRLYKRAKKKG